MRIGITTVVAAVGVAALSQIASAADLPVKAPSPYVAAPPVFSWSGLYVGLNGGYHVGRYDNAAVAPGAGDGPDGTSGRTSPAGGVFGGQIGYNWQVMPTWLLGVEGDFQWTGGKDSGCFGECGPASGAGDDFVTVESKLKWLGTARGRLGWIHNDYLWYITGGGAWGRVETTVTGFDLDTTAAPIGTVSQSKTKGGWTFGGGVETRFWQNWSAKLEYLYVDLGTVTTAGVIPINAVADQIVSVDTKVREHIFRAGINYKF
jgi:outer membrane immunogenic protein